MSKSAAQYLPLYKNIPNYIDAINEEVITNDGILRIGKVSIPGYQYFRAANDNIKRPCVIICPGGGYGILAASHEGTDVATFFNTIEALEKIGKKFNQIYAIFGIYSSNMNSPEFEPIETEMTPKFSEVSNKFYHNYIHKPYYKNNNLNNSFS